MTAPWLSSAVLKTFFRSAGIVVLRLDELGHDAAQGLDAQRERRDVQEQNVLDFARQHAALDRRADGHDLVRIDALVRLLAEHRLDDLLHLGDAGRTADQHHFVDLAVVQVRVLHGLLHRAAAALEQVIAKLLELRAVERNLHVLGARGVGRDERQVDIGRLQRAQFLLGLFAGLLEPLQGHRILAQVDAVVAFELVGAVIDQHAVEIVAAQVRVAVGADDAEDAFGNFQDRDVERAAAEVEDADLLLGLPVQAVGQRGRGRLVDDPHHFQPGDLAGVLGRLPLGVVEVGRHGDHGLVHLVAQVGLGRLLELAQDHGRDFRRRVLAIVDLDLDVLVRAADDLVGHDLLFGGDLVVPAAHEALDGIDGPPRVGDRLPLGRLADERFALVVEGDDAGGEPVSFLVGNDLRFFALHDGNDGIASFPGRCR